MSPVVWHDWVYVSGDGTFELTSVPPSGEMQLIAICDGWVSKTTMAGHEGFVAGQLFSITPSMEAITVAMERTGTIEIELQTPDGKPLEGGKISVCPNQIYHHTTGATVLGQATRSVDWIPPNEDHEIAFDGTYPFSNNSVRYGKAVVSGIPVGLTETYTLDHNDYVLDIDGQPKLEIQLKSANAQHMRVNVKRKAKH
ncbi:MAG: hypothetical protein WBD20_04260 [Pirellulaceae bacterium]